MCLPFCHKWKYLQSKNVTIHWYRYNEITGKRISVKDEDVTEVLLMCKKCGKVKTSTLPGFLSHQKIKEFLS